MARNDQHNPFGPRPLSDENFDVSHYIPIVEAFQSTGEYVQDNKWLTATLVGLCGGGLAYLLYKRGSRSGNHSSPQNQTSRSSRQQQPNRNVESEFTCIRDLPPEVNSKKFLSTEKNDIPLGNGLAVISLVKNVPCFIQIRSRIWEALTYEDLLNLRLTSQFTKYDVDTIVGLNGRITSTDPEKYDFFQRIALKSCKITELDGPVDQEFFVNPNILSSLEIREHTPIPIENIRAILAHSFNLKQLKLRLTLSENTDLISRIILEKLPSMKALTNLHVKTKPRFSSASKNFVGDAYPFTTPKQIKIIHLEMPDLPEEELSRWKCVLDKQVNLESLTSNLGNVSWRFYEQTLRHNSGIVEKLVLEGIHGWDSRTSSSDPLDWSIFSDSFKLKSLDLSCNRGGEHDLLDSINFERFPCGTIEEFFVSRIILPPDAVDKVYTEMVHLQRGALDHIGNAGIERANENAWLIHQADETLDEGWLNHHRWLECAIHCLFGLSIAVVVALYARYSGSSTTFAQAFRLPDPSEGGLQLQGIVESFSEHEDDS